MTTIHDAIRDPIDAVLAHREDQHGSYADTSRTAQHIKQALREGANWSILADHQKDALEMIAVKLARILSGNPNVSDHWDDITGYARLVSRTLHGRNLPKPKSVLEDAEEQLAALAERGK